MLKHTSKYNSWGLNGTGNWKSFIVEYSNQRSWKRSQISILYIKFPDFFSLESNIWKRPWISVSFKCVFSVEHDIWFSFQKGNIIFATSIHIYGKYHISIYLLRKIIFHFPSNEKISYLPEKNTIFPDIQERSYSSAIFLKRRCFRGIWRKYHISMYFFEKYHLSFSV